MNFHIVLRLSMFPTLMGLIFASEALTERALANVTHATALTASQSASQSACDLPSNLPSDRVKSSAIRHSSQGIAVASADLASNETGTLDFSEAESDAAVELFGCDCPSCLNALQQLRNQSFINGTSGHCWTSLQRRVSSQRMQEVIQNLEMREAEQAR